VCRRTGVSALMLVLGAGLLAAAAFAGGSGTTMRNGGTFRVSLQAGAPGLDYIDPALAYQPGSSVLLDASCGRLIGFPDKPSGKGVRLVPDLATGFPRVSGNGRVYTYTVRKNARFNTGARVTAAAFAHEINRVLNKSMQSPGAAFVEDVVGAADVMTGKTDRATGVRARGRTLTIRLTKPVPDLVARLAATLFCAVPPNLPADPEGVGAPLPSPGPYYFSRYVPGRRVELKRNPRYHGSRRRHISAFAIDLVDDASTILTRIERGDADWGFVPNAVIGSRADAYAARYGINKSRFFVKPGGGFLRLFSLNSSRPLFRNNARLRRAVNFAIDRTALQAQRGGRFAGTETDQYLEPGIPGFRDARIYPLRKPNLKKARALAKGHLRSGVANVYVLRPFVAQAQILQEDLARIGLHVSIKALPPSAYFGAIATPGEPVDIAWYGWAPDYPDPYDLLSPLLQPRADSNDAAYFNVPKYVRRLARDARRTGPGRYRAFGKLDVELARRQAPLLPYSYDNQLVLVSKRTGCVTFTPFFDLEAVCLKR
jgi:peptide/nickel transport system substrate-binding protein